MPVEPSERIGCRRPSQELKSPTTETARAAGAQTANAVPATPSMLAHVRAEALVELLVAALADQVQVELAERRQEAVRVVDRERAGRRRSRPRAGSRAAARALDDALEDAAGVRPARAADVLAVRRDDGRPSRPPGRQRADHDAAVVRVRAEAGVRVARARGAISRSASAWRSLAPAAARCPATGMATQSGRLLSS